MPATAGAAQRRETRRAFYAGAVAASSILLSVEELPVEDAVEVIGRLTEELTAFNEAVEKGKA